MNSNTFEKIRSGAQRQSLPSVRNRIYQYIYKSQGVCTRNSISDALGLSLPTVYQYLNELIENRLVCYSGQTKSTGGRRAANLDVLSDARLAIGISVTAHHLSFAAVDLRMKETAYRSQSLAVDEMSIDELADIVAQKLEIFIDENGIDRKRILGVCISVPGMFAADHRLLMYAPTLHMSDTDFSPLYNRIPYPAYADNDATRSGHAEWFMRGAKGNLAYISLEGGVGGSVFIDGHSYQGVNGRSSEFGHMCVSPGGLKCSCGKRGCLQAYCSTDRLSSELEVTLDEFFSAAKDNNLEYALILSNVLEHLAIGISNLRMAFDCDIVLGGKLSEYLADYMPLLKKYVLAGDPFSRDSDYVSLSVLGGHAVLLGAALYFIETFIDEV